MSRVEGNEKERHRFRIGLLREPLPVVFLSHREGVLAFLSLDVQRHRIPGRRQGEVGEVGFDPPVRRGGRRSILLPSASLMLQPESEQTAVCRYHAPVETDSHADTSALLTMTSLSVRDRGGRLLASCLLQWGVIGSRCLFEHQFRARLGFITSRLNGGCRATQTSDWLSSRLSEEHSARLPAPSLPLRKEP